MYGEPVAGAAVEEEPFDTEAIIEAVRPTDINPDDYKLPPEYQELMGERPVEAEDTAAEAPPAAPAAQPTTPEGEGHAWPFEDMPPEQAGAEAPPPPPADQPWDSGMGDEHDHADSLTAEHPAQAEPAAPELAPPIQPAAPPEDAGVPGMPPPPPGRAADELNSFFFEEDVEKKGKDQKGDNDSFWE